MKNESTIKLTLQQILQQHLDTTSAPINNYQRGVLTLLKHCKTAYMGGHWQACASCGHIEKHYNSCGNRHCPQCQGANRERWILEREYDLFDVAHHHVTFTVPSELRSLMYQNQKLLYGVLFRSMWDTLCSFSQDKRSRLQAQIGVIAILHTWTQKLAYHPHLHCIVPAGGLTCDGNWKHKNGKFLFSVKALSIVFKNKFIEELKMLYQKDDLAHNHPISSYEFTSLVNKVHQKKWVVHIKPGFASKSSVLEYLGRYTHKIAISNYRLIRLNNSIVTFSYRDRKGGDIKKVMSLPVDEFIKRFAWHILPKGFIKIRHYGLFATRSKVVKLTQVRKSLGQKQISKPIRLTIAEVVLKTTGRDIDLCPSCKAGKMVVVKEIPPARGSPRFPKIQNAMYSH